MGRPTDVENVVRHLPVINQTLALLLTMIVVVMFVVIGKTRSPFGKSLLDWRVYIFLAAIIETQEHKSLIGWAARPP